MSNPNPRESDKLNLFSFLFRSRVKVTKGDVAILNLSLLFFLFSVLAAVWLVVIGSISALILGYRFSFEKNSSDFGGSFDSIVKDAASNVKGAVNAFTAPKAEDAEPKDDKGAE